MDYEQKLQSFYEAFLRPGMTAVDVGGHAGRHGFVMAKLVGETGRVHMFEPLPSLLSQLAAAIQRDELLSTVVRLHPIALSDQSGEAQFCVAVDALAYSGLLQRKYDSPTRVETITVVTARLDDVLRDDDHLDYIKIDTEGAEWAVIKGAERLIEQHRPVVSFEFGESSYGAYGVDPRDVHRFFAGAEYAVYDILGHPLTEAAFDQSSKLQRVWDYVALPIEKDHLAVVLGSSSW